MSGFTSHDNFVAKVSGEQRRWIQSGSKQFNPTAAAVANEWHTLFRGGGYPQADAIFDAGTNLQFQSVFDVTTNAGCIYHGGNVGVNGDDFKTLIAGIANTAAATVVPGSLLLVDVLGFHRVTTVTTTTEQATVNSNTFTASSSTGLLLTYANDWSNYQKVRFTNSGGALPTGLSAGTDYWLVRQSATTAKVATSYANALAGTVVAYTDAGTGTHTLTCRLPRYSDGAGVQAIFFNPSSTALGAGTPGLALNYTNSAGTASRATPTTPSLPIGKTAATNSHVLYSGATGAGKMGPFMPLQAADAGIQSIQGIRNNATYTSGSYTVAYVKQLGRIPLNVLGQDTAMDFTTTFPSFPPVYDGAALYLLWKSGVATPANSAFDFDFIFGWNA
ncbi:MAG: hypothetical protein V5B60_18685 [Accumulibacter sp.]|jgi:hypothetical protein|uniref:hypothetical protein n=1 Tax=Accumulibacter sp. TaxID=2053492 RepID=UPI002FC396F3